MHRKPVLRLVPRKEPARGAKVIALRSRREARLEERTPKYERTRPDAA